MGSVTRILTAPESATVSPSRLPSNLVRRRPRSYLEWKTLRRWGKLPAWEDDPTGYLLRDLREKAGWTQQALARRLECSQQAVAQAERWESNPTIRFIKAWAGALEHDAILAFRASEGREANV